MSLVIEDIDKGVCWLRLNRPERHNAWTAEMGREMVDALLRVEADPDVRCVVVTGAGESFCAGIDLRDGFDRDPRGLPDLQGMHRRSFVPTVLHLRSLTRPVIAAVNGPAVGFGTSLAMAADFMIMSESAILLFAFVRLGLNPDGGTTAMLPKRVGRQRATEAMMLGERISAAKAVDWGLAHESVPAADLHDAVSRLAERLAAGPTRAYAAIKRALNAQERPALAEQLELEGDLVQSLSTTHDFAEGVAAFLDRRPAGFTGA